MLTRKVCPNGPSDYTTIHITVFCAGGADSTPFTLVVTSDSAPVGGPSFWRMHSIGNDMPSYQLPFTLIGATSVTTTQNSLLTCQKDMYRPDGNNDR
jgi:hypothetical protein